MKHPSRSWSPRHPVRPCPGGRVPPRSRWIVLLLAVTAFPGPGSPAEAAQPRRLREVRIESTHDGALQPALLWTPASATSAPTPLLVSLHTWSYDYRQDRSEWFAQAAGRGWIYLQPDFRGRNDHPQACGSPAARQDILDAIDWVADRYRVDPSRVYLAGVSGGGHMTLLMAARHPERFSAASAWVGISDLAAWYRFHLVDGVPQRYAQMIAACCGGPPGSSEQVDARYHDRSSIHHLHNAVGLPLDINAGVKDGKTGSVPIHHSLRAYNVVAGAGGHPTIPQATMDELWNAGRLANAAPGDTGEDPSYGREILLRRTAGAARVTIFDGGHEGFPAAACAWLSQQSRPTGSDR